MIWISDEWKEYEVLDTSNESGWSGGASTCWSARIPR